MEIFRSFNELAAARNKIEGKLALVPTMGALHQGHLSLVRLAKKHADRVMVSIFVNPMQFLPGEDLKTYPRNEAEDLKKLKGLADYVYLPQVKDIYTEGEKISVRAGAAGEGLEGEFRPKHLDGVATVVSILFAQVKPDVAVFGEKDYQQLKVIEEMNSPGVKIISAPIMREADGLAMSSRNIYLSEQERKVAPLLYKYLKEYGEGAKAKLEIEGFKVQYLAKRWNRVLIAAYLGKTRLIDNIALKD